MMEGSGNPFFSNIVYDGKSFLLEYAVVLLTQYQDITGETRYDIRGPGNLLYRGKRNSIPESARNLPIFEESYRRPWSQP